MAYFTGNIPIVKALKDQQAKRGKAICLTPLCLLHKNQFRIDHFECPITDTVYTPHPFHLSLRFKLFRDTLLFCQLLYKLKNISP